jgi:hypothetical protein
VTVGLSLGASTTSTPATVAAISNAQLFSWAAATYPQIFPGTPTAGVYQQYSYQGYSSGNYLAVDNAGAVYVLGPVSGNTILNVGTLTSFASMVTAWQATQPAAGSSGSGGTAGGTGATGGTTATTTPVITDANFTHIQAIC